MASIIRIKRSTVTGNPSTLGAGELAYTSLVNNDSNGGDRLYIGVGTETAGNAATHAIIGGKYFTDLLDHTRGNLQPSSALITDATSKIDQLKVDNIDLNGNTIISTDTNGDLNITPDGTGSTRIKNLVASNVTNSDLTIGRVTFAGTAGVLDDDSNFLWDDTNKQLNITGAAKVDNIKFDGNAISTTNDNGNLILRPLQTNADTTASQAVVQIDNIRGLVIPVGTTGNRPSSPLQGLVRYNTSISQFEGYNGTSYISIGGVRDVDGNTYIVPELSPGSNENTLFFYTDGVERMTLSASQLNVNTSITTILNATTASTTTTTGAFQVVGGAGIGGQLNVGGATNKFTAATASTTSATGALVVTGGVGIGGNLNVASNVNVTGLTTLAQAQVTDLTSGRLTYASTSGRLVDSANLTFSGTLLTVTGNETVTGLATLAQAEVTDLTSSRITYAGANGRLVDSANLTFSGTLLTVTGNAAVTGLSTLAQAQVSDLTSGRLTYAGTSGRLVDSANLTFNGTLLTVTGNAAVTGTFTVASDGTPSAVNIEASTLNLQAQQNASVGLSTNSASSYTLTLDALNSGVGGAHLDVNVKSDFTLDATTVSIDSTDSSNLSMTANSSSTKTLTIDATNAGAGQASIIIGSVDTDIVSLNANATTGVVDVNASQITVDVPNVDVNASTVDIVTSGGSDAVTVTSATTNVNSNTVNVIGKNGTADATVNITGILNVDNLRLDGNTIYTTDGSNTLYLDPAPMNNIGGVVVIKGDLQVDGTTTTINSTQVTIDDPIFVLGGDTTPAADDNLDRGIEFKWHNGTSAKLGFFGFDDSENEFIFIPDATDTATVISGTNGNAALGKLRLTDSTASTTTTTGAFTLSGGAGISGQLNVGGATNKFTAATASTSTTSGALVIAGGIGIGGTMYIGDDIIGSGAGTLASPGSVIDGFQIDGGTY